MVGVVLNDEEESEWWSDKCHIWPNGYLLPLWSCSVGVMRMQCPCSIIQRPSMQHGQDRTPVIVMCNLSSITHR